MQRPDPHRSIRCRPTASKWLYAALALALVLAQALGLLHRAAHAPQAAHHAVAHHAVQASGDVAMAAHAAQDHATSEHAGTGRFGHAPEQADFCRVFDQLALADLLVDATPALPVFDSPRSAIEATGTARALAVTTAYRARAPPLIG